MDFFQAACQTGPHLAPVFGLCDDRHGGVAYVDSSVPERWIATVKNPSGNAVEFTAIDKCVIRDGEYQERGRCDGMLTVPGLLYLVELKDKDPPWQSLAIEQLVSTIEFLKQHHDLRPYKRKKAFACNKRKPAFVEIDHETNRNFYRQHGFRLDMQATIVVI
ncbi:MAG: hypothetical protein WCG80_13505 [Spirochaetales bacterium]